jgi:hypothetical protein
MRTRASIFAGFAAIMLLSAVGCTHNHYYGAVPVCQAPAGAGAIVPSPVVAGTYCDVPQVSGTPMIVQANPGRASTVVTNRRPPTLVTSQPAGNASGGWRNRRDSTGATTRISGSIDDDEATR